MLLGWVKDVKEMFGAGAYISLPRESAVHFAELYEHLFGRSLS